MFDVWNKPQLSKICVRACACMRVRAWGEGGANIFLVKQRGAQQKGLGTTAVNGDGDDEARN